MSRLIEASLLAYPRGVRRRDGDHLRDLALELGEERGFLREAFGLLRGGVVARWRAAGQRRRAVVAASGAGLALVILAAPAVASPLRVEEEIVTCTADPCT
jgi:hypothetical protein